MITCEADKRKEGKLTKQLIDEASGRNAKLKNGCQGLKFNEMMKASAELLRFHLKTRLDI